MTDVFTVRHGGSVSLYEIRYIFLAGPQSVVRQDDIHEIKGPEPVQRLLVLIADAAQQTHMVRSVAARRDDLHGQNALAQALQQRVDVLHIAQLHIVDPKIRAAEDLLPPGKDGDRDADHQKRAGGRPVIPHAHSKADAGGGPQSRRGRQAGDVGLITGQDRSRAQKADAGDHLRAKAHRVAGSAQHGVYVQADNGGHGGADAHQNMGPEARSAAVPPTFAADAAAHQRGQHDPKGDGEVVERGKRFHHPAQQCQFAHLVSPSESENRFLLSCRTRSPDPR